MRKPRLEDLITPRTAGQLRGITAQAIHDLVKRGKLHGFYIDDVLFLNRNEVISYQTSKGGRPRKPQPQEPKAKGKGKKKGK